jgi:hypothetical protein
MLAACVLALFNGRPVTDYWPLALPIADQEIALAIWLLVKGFPATPPPTPATTAAAPALR